jgi:hypothetical protein
MPWVRSSAARPDRSYSSGFRIKPLRIDYDVLQASNERIRRIRDVAPPTAAGYVVCDDEAIWGYGATEYEARADFETTMGSAGIAVLADDEDAAGRVGSWTRAGNFRCLPATQGLLGTAPDRGGNVAWRVIGGIACTTDEDDATAAGAR